MTSMTLNSPFPYFGGKRKVVDIVWPRFGNVRNYVEPFFGSGAMLLGRPRPWTGAETVNDADGLLCNFSRTVKANPKLVAKHASWPVNENDLHARHSWLVGRRDSLQDRLEGDPRFYDAQAAGWWVWGMACWIGGEFCSGKGPWQRQKNAFGELVLAWAWEPGRGIPRSIADMRGGGRGVNAHGVTRKMVCLPRGSRGVNTHGVHRQVPLLRGGGNGVWRARPRLLHHGNGVNAHTAALIEWFGQLADRLARVRVCCGDWTRICGRSPTTLQGLTAVFLNPPYADTANRDNSLYRVDSTSVAHDVRNWAIEHGDNPLMRIALCGYEGEHKMPRSWTCVAGKAGGGQGYAAQKRIQGGRSINAHRERIWFSPHCLKVKSAYASAVSTRARKAVSCG